MNLDLTDDQRAILDALDGLTRNYAEAPMHDAPLVAASEDLNRELSDAGFLDVAFDPDLGTTTAAVVVERLARLPYAVEAAASALVRPLLGEDISGPVCLIDGTRAPRVVRFLAPGATVVVLDGNSVSHFTASEGQVRAEEESLYAYPVATLLQMPDDRTSVDVSADEIRVRWQVGIAAEAAGQLAAALQSTVAHVSDREQFGRKLATFQALRHRLAEAQVKTNGTYWLAMKAADTLDPADAAMAAWHAQEAARACTYDFHQFLGAMGMTLEHPLHFWTYRLKLLVSELGGRGANALAAADAIWGQPEGMGASA